MLRRIGNRILGRIIGLGIIAIIIFIVIPLIDNIVDFISKTPSWVLVASCCFGGILVFGGPFAIVYHATQIQEKQKEIHDAIEKRNNAALKLFDSRLNKDATKTKEDYLKLKNAMHSYLYELYVAGQPDLVVQKKLEMNNEQLELARNLFDELPIQKAETTVYREGLIHHIDRRIRSLELQQEPNALESFEKQIKEDPEGTVATLNKLSEIISTDPINAISLSKKLFGEVMLIDSWSIRNVYTKKRDEIRSIEEPVIISQALKVYKSKMAKNPEQVIKEYDELLPLLDYLRNPAYYGAPGRGDICQRVFSLSEKIYGERIEYDILFKITDNINQK